MEGTEENILSQDLLSQSNSSTQSELSTQGLLLAVSTSMPDGQPNDQPENPPVRQSAPSGRDPPKSRHLVVERERRQGRWFTDQQSGRRDAITAMRTAPMPNNIGNLATNTEEQPSQDVMEEQPLFNTGSHAQQQASLTRKTQPTRTSAPAKFRPPPNGHLSH